MSHGLAGARARVHSVSNRTSNHTPVAGEIHIAVLFAMRPVAAKYDYYYSRARTAALTGGRPRRCFNCLSTENFKEGNFKDWYIV